MLLYILSEQICPGITTISDGEFRAASREGSSGKDGNERLQTQVQPETLVPRMRAIRLGARPTSCWKTDEWLERSPVTAGESTGSVSQLAVFLHAFGWDSDMTFWTRSRDSYILAGQDISSRVEKSDLVQIGKWECRRGFWSGHR